MKKFLAIILVLALALTFVACSSNAPAEAPAEEAPVAEEAPAEAPADEKLTIGVTLLTREHTYYNAIEEAMIAAAPSHNFELVIQDAKSDANTQFNQIQDFITQQVDAIVMCPVNSSGLENAIELAVGADIPVFTMDVRTEGAIVNHVGIDNYAGGQLAADYAAELLDGVGEVSIIGYDEVSSCADRTAGFLDQIAAKYPDMKVVDNQNCSGNAEKAANIMQDMILKNPDLKLVFGVGDPFALGALQSISAAQEDILVIGFDGSAEAMDEIRTGGLFKATVWDNPTMLGELCLENVAAYFAGEEVPELYEYPPRMLDITNVDE